MAPSKKPARKSPRNRRSGLPNRRSWLQNSASRKTAKKSPHKTARNPQSATGTTKNRRAGRASQDRPRFRAEDLRSPGRQIIASQRSFGKTAESPELSKSDRLADEARNAVRRG